MFDFFMRAFLWCMLIGSTGMNSLFSFCHLSNFFDVFLFRPNHVLLVRCVVQQLLTLALKWIPFLKWMHFAATAVLLALK